MPGRGSYGPGGKWVYQRAKSLMPEMEEQYGSDKGERVAFAVATQMGHRLKKTPKPKGGYGTPTGRRIAKRKFDRPMKEYQKTAMWSAYFDEALKLAGVAKALTTWARGAPSKAKHLVSAQRRTLTHLGPKTMAEQLATARRPKFVMPGRWSAAS